MVSGLGESLGSQMPRGRARTLEHDAFSGAGGESPGQFEGRSHFGQKNLPKSPCYLRRYTSSIKKGTPHLEGKVRDTSRHTGPKKGLFATVLGDIWQVPPSFLGGSHPGQNPGRGCRSSKWKRTWRPYTMLFRGHDVSPPTVSDIRAADYLKTKGDPPPGRKSS